MTKIPLNVRLSSLVTKLYAWEGANSILHNFHKSKGVSKYFQIPGLLSSLMRPLVGDESAYTKMRAEGWVGHGWSSLFKEWIHNQLLTDKSTVSKSIIVNDFDFRLTIFEKEGFCVRRQKTGNKVSGVLRSPGGEAEAWLQSFFLKKGGGVIRISPLRNQDDSDDDYEPEQYDIHHTPWQTENQLVEGSWALSAKEIAKRLFKKGRNKGRSILLFGPPGVGKTETAIQSCLKEKGVNSQVLVIHGSLFSNLKNGMTGKATADLVTAFNASAIIIDDIPPETTIPLLEEFEAIHREQVPVVITLMTDNGTPRLPGLRPGRIDEIIEFKFPDAAGREFLLKELSGIDREEWKVISTDPRSEGMTPAYLIELISRVNQGDSPDDALSSLSLQMKISV